jgi:hypothetical protein
MASHRGRVLRFTWQAVRLPALAFLITLLPVVQIILGSVALLGMLTAFFFRFLGVPNFPFWGMLGCSLGCTLLLITYYGLMRLFSRQR